MPNNQGIQPKLWYEVFRKDDFKCVLCGKIAKENRLEIDHVVPIVYGDINNIKNLRVLCAECNKGKMLSEERKLSKI